MCVGKKSHQNCWLITAQNRCSWGQVDDNWTNQQSALVHDVARDKSEEKTPSRYYLSVTVSSYTTSSLYMDEVVSVCLGCNERQALTHSSPDHWLASPFTRIAWQRATVGHQCPAWGGKTHTSSPGASEPLFCFDRVFLLPWHRAATEKTWRDHAGALWCVSHQNQAVDRWLSQRAHIHPSTSLMSSSQ